jgi:hypothetical protein
MSPFIVPPRNAATGIRAICIVASLSLLLALSVAAEPPSFSGLRVETQPTGARVSCDGIDRGLSPVTVENLDPGDHLVVTRLMGYEEGRKTIALQPSGTAAVSMALRASTGLVLIRSNPQGADVSEGDTSLGQTPLYVDDLTLGKHRLTFRLTRYTEKNVELDIPDRTPIPVMVELSSDSATLNVESIPAGATVSVNGVDKGVTPVVLAGIPGGDAEVIIHADGFQPYSRKFKLSAGQREDLVVRLKELPVSLTIVSIPAKARIYIENQFSGEAPVERKNIQAGDIRVRAEQAGYRPLARTITLKRGDTVTEEFRLEKDTGVLRVTTRPAGAEVSVDGRVAGVTKAAKGAQADSMSEPFRIDVSAGEPHRVTIVKNGYLDDEQTLTLQTAETNDLRSVLKRVIVIDCEIETAYGSFSGALIRKYDDGSVKIETSPNKFKTIPAGDIKKMTRPGVDATP